MTSRRDIDRLNRILSDGGQTSKPTPDSPTQNRAPTQHHAVEVKSSTAPSHSFDMTQKEPSPAQQTSSSITAKNNSIRRTSSSISMASSVEAISIAGSLVDTDAALFAFEYEMLDEVDALCDDQGYANSVSIRNKDEYIEDGRMNKSHHVREESQELILFGIDFSHLSSKIQLMIAAFGVLFFNMLYGYLQELIQIEIAGRCFAFFLGSCQFLGYAFWSWVLAKLRARRIRLRDSRQYHGDQYMHVSGKEYTSLPTAAPVDSISSSTSKVGRSPLLTYLGLSIIRAIDLGLTNLSMKYLNYPAKTLIKSSRVVFTMMMGLVIGRKKYKKSDYIMVAMLVTGLAMFLHADMTTNAVFHPIGVFMLATSLTLDGTVSNWSELIMKQHNMGQDDFQMKLYSFSFMLMLIATFREGELKSGIDFFFLSDGTYDEYISNGKGEGQYTWSASDKSIAVFLFSTLGIFGGSCAAAITKRFGALTMSITTTTRKAATIFLSFAMFPNACSPEHIIGVIVFVSGLLMKGLKNHIRIPSFLLKKRNG